MRALQASGHHHPTTHYIERLWEMADPTRHHKGDYPDRGQGGAEQKLGKKELKLHLQARSR